MSDYSGYFADGKSAERVAVTARLTQAGLSIVDAQGRERALWPYRTLRLVEEVYRDQPVRLRSTTGEGRLSVRDQAILDALRPLSRGLGGGDMRGARTWLRALGWTAATAATLVALYFGLPWLAEPIAAMVPRSWEEKLGQSVMRQVEVIFGRGSRLAECRAPQGRAALDALTRRLAAQSDSDYQFRVRVVDSSIVNALAAPGGYIVVFRGLIDKAGSAEEVAGVIGHEMGHVIERHGLEALIRAQGMSFIIGSVFNSTVADYATTVLTLSYGRAAEREADHIGVDLLNRADIRGAGLAEFFRRVGGGTGEPGVMRYLSTHPPSGERAADIQARAFGKGDAMSASEWQALRAICTEKG